MNIKYDKTEIFFIKKKKNTTEFMWPQKHSGLSRPI